MKRLFIFILFLIIATSCTTKFDLYCYEGDTTIVYSILEVNADTNYFRITKSSLENEYTYNYDDIDVRFTGLFKNELQPDTITLDTISIISDGQLKTYYFTDKKLIDGQTYTLLIHRKADDVTISSTTMTINDLRFIKPVYGSYINFRPTHVNKIEWIGLGSIAPEINASYYVVTGYFHYRELMPGATDTVDRVMVWPIGTEQANHLFNTYDSHYIMFYTPSTFFTLLGEDEYLQNNSPLGVQRWLEPFEFEIIAYGEELYNYHIINNSYSAIQEVPNYTNIVNGIGLMSSRTAKSSFHVIEQLCRKRISENYDYGFYYDPNL